MSNLLSSLRGAFIVSCQSEGVDPFNDPQYIALFAKAAVMGGAGGVRIEGVANLRRVQSEISVPIIALTKGVFCDGRVRITGSWCEVESLVELHPAMIAVDGTFREREGVSGAEFIRQIKLRYPQQLVLADVATYDEAVACQDSGADAISTTLSGYTPDTESDNNDPDMVLISRLASNLHIQIFAEGRINTPEQAGEAMLRGAYGVITGSAITRPRVVTSWFVDKIRSVASGDSSTPYRDRASKISYLFTDVDGTLTDGNSYYNSKGEELKMFSLRDGGGFYLLRRMGITPAIITGENTPIVQRRAEKLGVKDCFMGVSDKLHFVLDYAKAHNIAMEQIAYIGDDLNDYALLESVGLSFATSGAHSRVKGIVDFVCTRDGGNAAFREAVELLIALRGVDVVELYRGDSQNSSK